MNSIDRRGFLGGAGALAAAGWIAGMSGGWVLRPRMAHGAGPIKMGIATDITGPIAAAGIPNWQAAQLAVEQINAVGGIAASRSSSSSNIPPPSEGRRRQRSPINPGPQGRRRLGGITSAMRQAIKDPIVNRGRTLYIYPSWTRVRNAPSSCSTPGQRRPSNATG